MKLKDPKSLLGKTKPRAALAVVVPWGGVGNDLPGGYPRGEKGTVKIDDPQPTNEQNVGPHRLDRISVHAQPPHNSRSVLVVRKHSDNLRSKVRCLKQCGLSYGSPRKREADRHFFFGGFAFSISLDDKVLSEVITFTVSSSDFLRL